MKKIVYSYDPETKQYVGTAIAFEDPMEEGNYLVPANATDVEPQFEPYQEGYYLAWNGSEWTWKPFPIEEVPVPPALTNEELAQAARVKRNILLAESDWTQLNDCVLSKEVIAGWKQYRADLRNISKQVLFPTDIDWPVKPS